MPVTPPKPPSGPGTAPVAPEDRDPQGGTAFASAIGAGAASVPFTTAAGTAAGLAAVAPAVAALALAGKTVAAILKGLRRFFRLQRARQNWAMIRRWRETPADPPLPLVPTSGAAFPEVDLSTFIADENGRQVEFERRAAERVTRDALDALKLSDRPLPVPDVGPGSRATPETAKPGAPGSNVSPRRAALDAAERRERFYARLRAEAQAARFMATIDRMVLAREDPDGAVWILGEHVQKHTPDCIAAAAVGFWPWAALAIYHPVAHPGCQCRLETRARARAAGLWTPGRPMSIADAVARMAAIKAMGHEH